MRETINLLCRDACGRFTGAAILLDLIIDLLTINEGGETGAFNGGDMDEDVLTTAHRAE